MRKYALIFIFLLILVNYFPIPFLSHNIGYEFWLCVLAALCLAILFNVVFFLFSEQAEFKYWGLTILVAFQILMFLGMGSLYSDSMSRGSWSFLSAGSISVFLLPLTSLINIIYSIRKLPAKGFVIYPLFSLGISLLLINLSLSNGMAQVLVGFK